MATTTNYAWETPDDTDLVKDGAAAIRTLGSSIDTTTKALNPSTTLGDIEYRSSTANTNTRLGIGSSGQVLTVSGGVPAWSTPASSGGMTLLSTTTLSGSSTTVSSISGSYNQLYIQINDAYASSNGSWYFRVNGDSTANAYQQLWSEAASNNVYANATPQYYETRTNFQFPATVAGSDKNSAVEITFANYADTSARKMMSSALYTENAGGNQTFNPNNGFWNNASAITSFTFGTNGGTWTQGSIKIWGIK